jgi:hypothetical protein
VLKFEGPKLTEEIRNTAGQVIYSGVLHDH